MVFKRACSAPYAEPDLYLIEELQLSPCDTLAICLVCFRGDLGLVNEDLINKVELSKCKTVPFHNQKQADNQNSRNKLYFSLQMWWYGGSHFDVSLGGGKDEAAVFLHNTLHLQCSAQHSERSHHDPSGYSRTLALPQVRTLSVLSVCTLAPYPY